MTIRGDGDRAASGVHCEGIKATRCKPRNSCA